MSSPTLTASLTWLARHAGYPARRLPREAELGLLFAAAAAQEEAEARAAAHKGLPVSAAEAARTVSQRQLAMNRSHAHFKSDNRSKV